MKVGDEFTTFTQFKEVLDEYSAEKTVSTYISDSIKIATAQKRGLKKTISADLIYYSIKFGCVKGGRNFKTRGEGLRDTRYLFYVKNARKLRTIPV